MVEKTQKKVFYQLAQNDDSGGGSGTGPTGPTGPQGDLTGPTGPTGPSNVSSQNVFYVAKGGNDITGNGQSFNPFGTIQKAIDSCPTGSSSSLYTIFIYPGNYAENLNITDKNINFIGSGNQEFTYNTTIQGNNSVTTTPTITLNTSGLNFTTRTIGFQNLQIQNNDGTGTATTAIKLSSTASSKGKLNIQNCYITSNVTGTSLIDASNSICNWQIIINLCKIYTDKQITSALLDIGGTCTFLLNQSPVNYNRISNSPLIKLSGTSSNTIQNSSLVQDNIFSPSLTTGLLYVSNLSNGTPATNATVLNNNLFYSITHATIGATGTCAIFLDGSSDNPKIPPVYCTNCTFSVRSNNPTSTYAITGQTGSTGPNAIFYYSDKTLYSTNNTAYKIDNTNIISSPIQNLTNL